MEKTVINSIIAFIRKYKVLHILFWIWTFTDLVHLQQQNGAPLYNALHNATVVKLGQMCCVYFLVYYLMPRLLFKGNYAKFITALTITLLAADALTWSLREIDTYIRLGRFMRPLGVRIFLITDIHELAVISGFFFAVYAVHYFFSTEQRNRILEKERLETELNFLKAQINPHFLFNTINSVYVLIDEDKKLASQTLLKFSGLLRYQLYDCTNDEMPLERELEFLHDYVDLETLRNSNDVAISFRADATGDQLRIAPFILIPFVENAFKHRSHYRAGNFVQIKAEIRNNTLHFTVSNTYDDSPATPAPYGGIGLQNVHRRLELLYTGRHTLNVTMADGIYSVELQLELNEHAMYTGR